MTITNIDWRSHMRVNWPEGTHGSASLKRFEVSDEEARLASVRSVFSGGRGRIAPGSYTSLYINGALWMSDTPDEQRDHLPFLWMAEQHSAEHALVNGLGLGMVIKALCHLDTITTIDVVDNNPDVIALVGPHVRDYGKGHDKEVNVICGDAHDPAATFGKGIHWDVVWHDIWVDICADNWESMKILRRRHARHCIAQATWCEDETKRAVRRATAGDRDYQSRMRWFH